MTMFAYLKGAGASAFVATLLTPLALLGLPQPFGYSTQGLYLALSLVLLSNYVGCILGWILLLFLNKNSSLDTGEAIMLYVLLGVFFTTMLSFVFSYFVLVFTLITISGAISFYLAQRIKNRMLSWGLILFGPFALIAASSSYLYLTLSPFM